MVWAQKNTAVLAVGVPFAKLTLAFGPNLLVDQRTFDDAENALNIADYAVMVIDPTGREADAARLVDVARALHPHIRVIYSTRRTEENAPMLGEMLVAGNGRQFVRGLRTLLGR